MSEIIPEAHGSYGGLNVTIRNLPCRRDANTGERTFSYSNFGNDFLNGFHEQIGDFALVCAKLKTGAPARAYVTVSTHSPITVEVSGTPNSSKNQFDSDIADALIEAFKSIELRP